MVLRSKMVILKQAKAGLRISEFEHQVLQGLGL